MSNKKALSGMPKTSMPKIKSSGKTSSNRRSSASKKRTEHAFQGSAATTAPDRTNSNNRSVAARLFILVVLIGIITLIIIMLNYYQVPYQATESYTEEQPYTITETYTESEPYNVTSQVVRLARTNKTRTKSNTRTVSVYECGYENLSYSITPVGNLSIKGYDYFHDVGYLKSTKYGTGWYIQNWKFCNYEKNNVVDLVFDICKVYDDKTIDCWLDIQKSVGSKSCSLLGAYRWYTSFDEKKDIRLYVTYVNRKKACKWVDKEFTKTEKVPYVEVKRDVDEVTVTEYRDVEKTRDVIRYRTVKKQRNVTKYQSVWNMLFSSS